MGKEKTIKIIPSLFAKRYGRHFFAYSFRFGGLPPRPRHRREGWCGRGELNPQGLPHSILSAARLPISPRPHFFSQDIIKLFHFQEFYVIMKHINNTKEEKMKRYSYALLGATVLSCLPLIAGAAGTYYNGNLYQNPQRYGAGGGSNDGGFYNNYGMGRGYGQNMQGNANARATVTQTNKKTVTKKNESAKKNGFVLGADLRHEFANWNFEMKNAGSKLHYDNLRWNIISGEGAYYFGGSTPMQIKVGAMYGSQWGESPMIDDDVSNEGMWEIQQINVDSGSGVVAENVLIGTPALSVGNSKGGNQFGFNAAFGFTDLFSIGNVKMTPSIGYRYLKYKLETKNNYGLMVNVLDSNTFINCLEVSNGEIQCSPYVGFADANDVVFSYAGLAEEYDVNGNFVGYVIENNTAAPRLDLGETYYYEQHGTSHSYETSWAGPYLALDMEYAINNNNLVNAGIEFGLPIYDAKGDQPYRFDWAHPTSVEDKGDFGDAWHLGLNAMWSTALSDSVMLSLGMTYDYYKVNNATAKTYLNSTYYQSTLDNVDAWVDYYEDLGTLSGDDEIMYESYKAEQAHLESLKSAGWTIENKSEIESIYKSMGIRLGLNVKF